MTSDATTNGKLSAAEKKKLRKQKAKQERKHLKEESKQLHSQLHQAQEHEASHKSRKKGGARADNAVPYGTNGEQVLLEYVAEPLETLQELKAAAESAALASNVYEGVEGLEVKDEDAGASAYSELDRIAKHFAPGADEAPAVEAAAGAAAAEEAVDGTDAVVTTGTEDDTDRLIAQAEQGADWHVPACETSPAPAPASASAMDCHTPCIASYGACHAQLSSH